MGKRLNVIVNVCGAILFFAVFVLIVGRYSGLLSDARIDGATSMARSFVREVIRPIRVAAIRRAYSKYELDATSASLFRTAIGGSVPVLVYHGIDDIDVVEGWSDVTRKEFMSHLFAIKKAGFRTLSIGELRDFLDGKTVIDDRAVVITFDDGIRTSYENTDDILEALDMKAVMFAISDFSFGSDKPYYLHDEDYRKMLASGRWDVQSHGDASHYRRQVSADGRKAPMLANLLWVEDEARLETVEEFGERVSFDLATARERLEEFTGNEVFAFAVPFNDFGQLETNHPGATTQLLEAVWKSYDLLFYQFRTAVGGEFRSNFPSKITGEKRAVMRISMDKETTAADVLMRLAASERKSLPYTEDFKNPSAWVDAWSSHTTTSDGMLVEPNLDATSYFGYLDGTYDWTDYRIDATVDWQRGRVFSLVSRLKNALEYLSCDYGAGAVQIRHVSRAHPDGSELLATKPSDAEAGAPRSLSMTVGNGTVSCLYDGKVIVRAPIQENVSENGGVAVKIWDPVNGEGKAVVTSFSVSPY